MYKQGDIVLIPVPFSDLTKRKQRPVLHSLTKHSDKKFGHVNYNIVDDVSLKISKLIK